MAKKAAVQLRNGIVGVLDMVKAIEDASGFKLDAKMRAVVIKAYRMKLKECKPVKRSNCKTSTAFASNTARPKGNTQGERLQDWSYNRLAK